MKEVKNIIIRNNNYDTDGKSKPKDAVEECISAS